MAEAALKHHLPAAPESDPESAPATPGPPPVETPPRPGGEALRVHDLEWSEVDAAATRARLRPFEEDWNAPGMDAYDDL